MVKIRLHCLPEDANKAIDAIKSTFKVYSVSGPYSDRGNSVLVRFYLEADVNSGQSTDQFNMKQAFLKSKQEGLI